MAALDETHDPARRCWVKSANGHPEFPIQNLPFGVFSPADGEARGGIAIGDWVFDIPAALAAGLFSGEAETAARTATSANLNALMALGAGPRRALRWQVSALLAADGAEGARAEVLRSVLLHPAAACTFHLPAAVGDYTDFFAGIHHARNAGRIFRPEGDPLPPAYRYVPIAYHGRASSVRPSGTPVLRPHGQSRPDPAQPPQFGPCRALDYEFEFGVWIGPGNAPGQPVPVGEAAAHIFGFCLLNDWSARDIQAWESQPLGPFLAKNFQTSVSPWVVTPEALAPFRCAQPSRPESDPAPPPYLWDDADQREGALDVALEALLLTPAMAVRGLPPQRLSRASTRDLYWTFAQMVAHHSSGGCNLREGDLFGSGTVSSTEADGCGCLLELTRGGREPVSLSSGETRGFLEDGDEVILRAHCHRQGFVTIGFGECRGRVVGASPSA